MSGQQVSCALDDRGHRIPGSARIFVAAKRCQSVLFGGGQCIGVEGHDGDHWRYGEDGTYHACRDGGGASFTPCGHPRYVSPIDRDCETHSAHSQWVPIADDDVCQDEPHHPMIPPPEIP